MTNEATKTEDPAVSALLERLREEFGDAILETEMARDMPVIVCTREKSFALLKFMKEEAGCNLLTDVTAVDYLKYPIKQRQRFAVVYLLHSLEHGYRFRIKVYLGMAHLNIDSVESLWKTANWLEREVFDMYGVEFNNHPNLKRILNHIEFEGHPLRKNYPIERRQVLTINDSLMDEMEKRLVEKGLK